MIAACTIVSPNYLPFARTLAASYLQHHPGHHFFVLLVADLPADFVLPTAEPFQLLSVTALSIPNFRAEAMKYDILELNTNVKPSFLRHLFVTHGLSQITYLDPDILVTAPLDPVLNASGDIILTPHLTSPIEDGKSPGEQDILYNGTYNLGFISLRNTPNALRFLDWWERRCLDLGFSEGRTGLFVDQKWINLAPGLFDQICILRDPGCNMAFWNLHERSLAEPSTAPETPAAGDCPLVESLIAPPTPLRFFHFSGIVLADPESLSRNTDRFTLSSRPDLQPLFAQYRAAVLQSQNPATDNLPYGFDTLSDGTYVTRLARRIFAAHVADFPDPNPFRAEGPFARFALRLGLLRGAAAPQKQTWTDFRSADRRVAAVHHLLRLALRVLGPHRYELLMRYLAHIAVLRHQAVFLAPHSDRQP